MCLPVTQNSLFKGNLFNQPFGSSQNIVVLVDIYREEFSMQEKNSHLRRESWKVVCFTEFISYEIMSIKKK